VPNIGSKKSLDFQCGAWGTSAAAGGAVVVVGILVSPDAGRRGCVSTSAQIAAAWCLVRRHAAAWAPNRPSDPGRAQSKSKLLQGADATLLGLSEPRLQIGHQLLGRKVGAGPEHAQLVAFGDQLGETGA